MPTPQGMKMININNIASIEHIHNKTIVTLNVKRDNEFISFEATLTWGVLTGQIQAMDQNT